MSPPPSLTLCTLLLLLIGKPGSALGCNGEEGVNERTTRNGPSKTEAYTSNNDPGEVNGQKIDSLMSSAAFSRVVGDITSEIAYLNEARERLRDYDGSVDAALHALQHCETYLSELKNGDSDNGAKKAHKNSQATMKKSVISSCEELRIYVIDLTNKDGELARRGKNERNGTVKEREIIETEKEEKKNSKMYQWEHLSLPQVESIVDSKRIALLFGTRMKLLQQRKMEKIYPEYRAHLRRAQSAAVSSTSASASPDSVTGSRDIFEWEGSIYAAREEGEFFPLMKIVDAEVALYSRTDQSGASGRSFAREEVAGGHNVNAMTDRDACHPDNVKDSLNSPDTDRESGCGVQEQQSLHSSALQKPIPLRVRNTIIHVEAGTTLPPASDPRTLYTALLFLGARKETEKRAEFRKKGWSDTAVGDPGTLDGKFTSPSSTAVRVHFLDPRESAGPGGVRGWIGEDVPVRLDLEPGEMIIFPSFVKWYVMSDQVRFLTFLSCGYLEQSRGELANSSCHDSENGDLMKQKEDRQSGNVFKGDGEEEEVENREWCSYGGEVENEDRKNRDEAEVSYWPSPIYHSSIFAGLEQPTTLTSQFMLQNMTNLIRRLQSKTSSKQKSNRGGWQSDAGLLSGERIYRRGNGKREEDNDDGGKSKEERMDSQALQLVKKELYKSLVQYFMESHKAIVDRERERSDSTEGSSVASESSVIPLMGDVFFDIHASWAGINEKGSENAVHIHPESHLSGVLYIDVGYSVLEEAAPTQHHVERKESDDGGGDDNYSEIYLVDPRPPHVLPSSLSSTVTTRRAASSSVPTPPALSFQYPSRTTNHEMVRVVSGDILLFPSWMKHYVLPHNGPSSRIMVAFNCRVEWKRSAGLSLNVFVKS